MALLHFVFVLVCLLARRFHAAAGLEKQQQLGGSSQTNSTWPSCSILTATLICRFRGNQLNIDPQLVLAGAADQCIFLVDYHARYTIVENLVDVMIDGASTSYMTLRRSYTSAFERREYLPRSAGDKIVHYSANMDPYRRDAAAAIEAAN